MKKILAAGALAALVATGCSTSDDYGASDDQFSTPSWGTSSSTLDLNPPSPMGGTVEPDAANPVTPPMDSGHQAQPDMSEPVPAEPQAAPSSGSNP